MKRPTKAGSQYLVLGAHAEEWLAYWAGSTRQQPIVHYIWLRSNKEDELYNKFFAPRMRLAEEDGIPFFVELEGPILEDIQQHRYLKRLASLARSGLFAFTGLYAQAYPHSISEEATLRHLIYQKRLIEKVFGIKPDVIATQEATLIDPRALKFAGYDRYLYRPVLGTMGNAPLIKQSLIKLTARDGSWVSAIPRYHLFSRIGGTSFGGMATYLQNTAARLIRNISCPVMFSIEDVSRLLIWGPPFIETRLLNNRLYKIVSLSGAFEALEKTVPEAPEVPFSYNHVITREFSGALFDRYKVMDRLMTNKLYDVEALLVFRERLGRRRHRAWKEMESIWKSFLTTQSHAVEECPLSYSRRIKTNPLSQAELKNKVNLRRIGEIESRAIRSIHSSLKPGPDSILLINTLPWQRKEIARVPIRFSRRRYRHVRILDTKGNPFNYRILDIKRDREGLIDSMEVEFILSLPPTGYRLLTIEKCDEEYQEQSSNEREFITDYYRLAISSNNELTIKVRDGEKNGVVSGNRLHAFSRRLMGKEWGRLEYIVEETHVKSHPLGLRVMSTGRLGKMGILSTVDIYRSHPRVVFTYHFDCGRHRLRYAGLGVEFNPPFPYETYSDVPFSLEKRTSHRFASQTFTTLTNGRLSTVVLNRGNRGNLVRDKAYTLILGNYYNWRFSGAELSRMWLEGKGVTRFGLILHKGFDIYQDLREAYGFNHPPCASYFPPSVRGKPVCKEGEFLSIKGRSVPLSLTRDGRGHIYRFYNPLGRRQRIGGKWIRPHQLTEVALP